LANPIGPNAGKTLLSPFWEQIVPGGGAGAAFRFYLSPYNPDLIYIVDQNEIKRSDNGGTTWTRDAELTRLPTNNGMFPTVSRVFTDATQPMVSILQDMVFSRDEPGTRFAIGIAGVFYTLDGIKWKRLLSSVALPGIPTSGAFVTHGGR